jgi:hypothetical protein
MTLFEDMSLDEIESKWRENILNFGIDGKRTWSPWEKLSLIAELIERLKKQEQGENG